MWKVTLLKKHKGDGMILKMKKRDGENRENCIGLLGSSKYWFWCFISFLVSSVIVLSWLVLVTTTHGMESVLVDL